MNKKMLMNNGSINKHFHVIKEDFEDDNFNFNITGTWVRYRPTGGQLSNKTWVYKSKTISHNNTTSFSFDIKPMGYSACLLYFTYDVSSEKKYDHMYFTVNGTQIHNDLFSGRNSGDYSYQITDPTKVNTVVFTYRKDSSMSEGRDDVYIGEIRVFYYNKEGSFVPKVNMQLNTTNVAVTNTAWTIKNGYIASETISHSSQTTTKINIKNQPKDILFARISYEVSSERNYDFGYCFDANNKYLFEESGSKSGSITVPIFDVSSLTFGYKKDASSSLGDDRLLITKIEFGNLE